MKKYQITKAFLIIVSIILVLSAINRILYLNKHIRIHNAYIWAPQNIIRIDKKGFLVRVEVKPYTKIKKGVKLGYMEFNIKPIKSAKPDLIKKNENDRINNLINKLDLIMKKNVLNIGYLSTQLNFISEYLEKSFNSNRKESKKIINDQNKSSLFFKKLYKSELKSAVNKKKRLESLYKNELVAKSEITRQKIKIKRLKLLIKGFSIKPNNQFTNIKLTIPSKHLHRLNLPGVVHKTKAAASVEHKQPERYSYIISYVKGIVYKIVLSAPATVYPRENFITYYKPKKMRIIAFYSITKDIVKGADVTIRIDGKKIKGKVEKVTYNDKSTGINDKIKLIIKAESSIEQFPLYKLVTVDIKQSKWF